MSFLHRATRSAHQAIAQNTADGTRLKDAELRCQTIVGDEHAHWLIHQVNQLQRGKAAIRTGSARTFQFLSADAEAVLYRENSTYTVLRMPAGSIVSRLKGTGYRTWVFRVDNDFLGSARSYFDLHYRKIATDAHMLSLIAQHHGTGRPL